MPTPDIRNKDLPVGPLRIKEFVTLGDPDYVQENGFICQIGEAGEVIYRCVEGESDLTETVAAGTILGVGNHPVLLQYVRGHTNGTAAAITTLIIGRL